MCAARVTRLLEKPRGWVDADSCVQSLLGKGEGEKKRGAKEERTRFRERRGGGWTLTLACNHFWEREYARKKNLVAKTNFRGKLGIKTVCLCCFVACFCILS